MSLTASWRDIIGARPFHRTNGPGGQQWPHILQAAVVWGGIDAQDVAHEGIDVGAAERFGNEALLECWAMGDEERVHRHEVVVVTMGAEVSCGRK